MNTNLEQLAAALRAEGAEMALREIADYITSLLAAKPPASVPSVPAVKPGRKAKVRAAKPVSSLDALKRDLTYILANVIEISQSDLENRLSAYDKGQVRAARDMLIREGRVTSIGQFKAKRYSLAKEKHSEMNGGQEANNEG